MFGFLGFGGSNIVLFILVIGGSDKFGMEEKV